MNPFVYALALVAVFAAYMVGAALVCGFRFHARSQALVHSRFLQRMPFAMKFPEGICKDCHGIFQSVSETMERCNGCGEIRELIDGVWWYHLTHLADGWSHLVKVENPAKTITKP